MEELHECLSRLYFKLKDDFSTFNLVLNRKVLAGLPVLDLNDSLINILNDPEDILSQDFLSDLIYHLLNYNFRTSDKLISETQERKIVFKEDNNFSMLILEKNNIILLIGAIKFNNTILPITIKNDSQETISNILANLSR